MPVVLTQTDTAAPCGAIQACSARATGTGAAGRGATPGGTPGTGNVGTGNQNNGTHLSKIMFEWTPAVTVEWKAGTWVIRLNIVTGNLNLTIEEAYVCRLNSGCTSQATIGSATVLAIQASAGVKTINVTGAAQTPGAGDKVYVVLTVSNQSGQMNQAFTWLPDQNVDTPFTEPERHQTRRLLTPVGFH